MGDVRYALRVRGSRSDAALAAKQEGLDLAVHSKCTAIYGWFPDQAALYGLFARIQLLGLELVAVRRLPDSVDADQPAGAVCPRS